jgi:hypothetical protein
VARACFQLYWRNLGCTALTIKYGCLRACASLGVWAAGFVSLLLSLAFLVRVILLRHLCGTSRRASCFPCGVGPYFQHHFSVLCVILMFVRHSACWLHEPQRLLSMSHVFIQPFAGQQVTFVRCLCLIRIQFGAPSTVLTQVLEGRATAVLADKAAFGC